MGLTEAGRGYHERVSGAMVELASATLEMMRDKNDGLVNIWCVPGFAAQWIAPRLAEFDALNPTISVEMRPTDAVADLMMREADIDVRYYGDDWLPTPGGRGLKYVELARPEVFVVASPQVAARFADAKSAQSFVNGPLLHEEHHEQWRAWFRRNKVQVPDNLAGPKLWHAHLAIAAAKQGRGIALANNYLVERDLEQGELVQLKVPDAGPRILGAYVFAACEERWNWPPITRLRQYLQASLNVEAVL